MRTFLSFYSVLDSFLILWVGPTNFFTSRVPMHLLIRPWFRQMKFAHNSWQAWPILRLYAATL